MVERLALDEQETNFTIEATNRSVLHVYSNDSVWQRRVESLGVEPYREDGYGKFYKVDLSEFNFGIRRKRQMTDEQREALRQRMLSLHENGA